MTSAWLAAHWPAIAAAAGHAEHFGEVSAPAGFEYLSAADAADVLAIAVQIVPSGTTPGAREAHAAYFIDRALGTFFSQWADEFRLGLSTFQATFRGVRPAAESFAAASADAQTAFLLSMDQTPFFELMRTLTLLGMFSSPKYAGNFERTGWTLLGFEDQHQFSPPFGYYDRDYAGFVPYRAEKGS